MESETPKKIIDSQKLHVVKIHVIFDAVLPLPVEGSNSEGCGTGNVRFELLKLFRTFHKLVLLQNLQTGSLPTQIIESVNDSGTFISFVGLF